MGDIVSGIGLGRVGWGHHALGATAKSQYFDSIFYCKLCYNMNLYSLWPSSVSGSKVTTKKPLFCKMQKCLTCIACAALCLLQLDDFLLCCVMWCHISPTFQTEITPAADQQLHAGQIHCGKLPKPLDASNVAMSSPRAAEGSVQPNLGLRCSKNILYSDDLSLFW